MLCAVHICKHENLNSDPQHPCTSQCWGWTHGAALAGDQGLVPSNQVGEITIACSSSSGTFDALFWLMWEPALPCSGTDTQIVKNEPTVGELEKWFGGLRAHTALLENQSLDSSTLAG